MVGAFFSFGGWWDLSKLDGECANRHTLPKYELRCSWSPVYILHVQFYISAVRRVTSGETFAAQAGEVLFGRAGGQVFALTVIVAVLGSLVAVVMSAPRVYFAMARDGLFVPAVASLHPRFETPARAIGLQAVLSSLLVLRRK